MNKQLFALTAAATVVFLAGCEAELQDGTQIDSRQAMTGLVVDGRVAGGKVWADMNNNNRIDDFEPYAFTDSDGYYSYNPLTNTNYCSLPVISDEYQRYCLIYGSSSDSIVVRIKGGTDLSTGEKLKGVMAMSTTISSSSQISSTPLVLSPITTLLSSASNDTDRNSIRNSLGITSDSDLRLDFSTALDEKSKKFLANSVAVQTMMDILVSSADDSSDTVNHELNVIKQITNKVAQGNKPPTDLSNIDLSDITKVVTINTAKQGSVSDRLAQLNAEIKKVQSAANPEAVKAQLKASEVISQLVKKESSNSDADAVKKVLDSGIANLSNSLNTQLNSNTVEFDIATITNSLVDAGKTAVTNNANFDQNSVNTAVEESKLATGTTWGGQWFVLEATAEHSDDLAAGSYIAIYLDGTSEANNGSIGVCVNVSPSVDEGETVDSEEVFENEYLSGRWNKISSGTLTLIFDYEGQEFEGQMKAKAATTDNGAKLFRFSSDIDGATEQGDLKLNANSVSALAGVGKPLSSTDCANKVDPEI